MQFSSQEHWSGFPFPPPGGLGWLGANIDSLSSKSSVLCQECFAKNAVKVDSNLVYFILTEVCSLIYKNKCTQNVGTPSIGWLGLHLQTESENPQITLSCVFVCLY